MHFLLIAGVGLLALVFIFKRTGEGIITSVADRANSGILEGPSLAATGYRNGAAFPMELAPITGGLFLRADAADAYNRMMLALSKRHDFPAQPTSAFRTNDEQAALHAKYLAGKGDLAAPPGHSEHQEGICVDEAALNPDADNYNFVKDKWLDDNCGSYGWVRNGLNFGEPWHMTYRG